MSASFLIDAQLPKKLCKVFHDAGFTCSHTVALEDSNRTSDEDVASIADQRDAIVVTKDDDFRISHRLHGTPKRLILIAIGNCSNSVLTDLIRRALPDCLAVLAEPGMVELRKGILIATPLPAEDSSS
jgi:predicted nuclease of predicted toxin-antitoxin system